MPRPLNLRVQDERGRTLYLPGPPQRVVSLVPSDTYMLFQLGVGDRVVGRSRYCVEPAPNVEPVEIIGGTKNADVERIIALAPDLVFANQEENSKRDVERLEQAGIKVLVAFPQQVASGLRHLARMARIFEGTSALIPNVLRQAYADLTNAERQAGTRPVVSVFLPIWAEPLMTMNGDTHISDALALAGGHNVFSDRKRLYPLAADLGHAPPKPAAMVSEKDNRYPRISLEEVTARAPDVILLPDEPHPFSPDEAKKFHVLEVPAAKNGHIYFCDGKDLMWPGSRALSGISRIRELLDRAR